MFDDIVKLPKLKNISKKTVMEELDTKHICMTCGCIKDIDWDTFTRYIGPSNIICPNCKVKMKRFDDLPKIIAEEIVSVQPMTNIDDSDELKCPDPTDFEDDIEWSNPFKDARYTMMEYFANDEGLRFAYQSNIAMFLNDRCNITDHEERNKLAKEIMDMLWS